MTPARIILVRHGPVALKAPGLLSFAEFARFIEAYELSGVDPQAAPPAETARALAVVATVFASDAPRALDTLARLGLKADMTDAAFREAPPLAPRLPLRLPAIAWLALARARGELGPGLGEARRDLRLRADRCAERLIAASRRGDVALVGHGWFNRSVGAALRARGWRGKTRSAGGAHWSCAVLAAPGA